MKQVAAERLVLTFLLFVFCVLGIRAFAVAPPPTEAQMLKIIDEANEAEIKAAKRAQSYGASAEVKKFAKHMIDEHKANLREAKSVAKKAKIRPQKSDMSESLEKDVKAKFADLKKQPKGADFDRTYIDQQIAMHDQLLKDLEQNMIPAATTPEVKQFLETTKNHVQEHLTRARSVQSTLQ